MMNFVGCSSVQGFIACQGASMRRTILRVRISHQHGRDIPRWLFYEMLRQAGLDEASFRKLLGRR